MSRARKLPRVRLLAGIGLLALTALGFSGISAAQSGSATQSGSVTRAGTAKGSDAVTIRVILRDSSIALSKKAGVAGKVTFVVKNAGKLKHNFLIGGKRTPILAPRKVAKLVVTFKKAGNYAYRSTLAGDVKKGLKGAFKVTAPKATAPVSATPGNAAAGKTVFLTNGCNACHTLAAAGAQGNVGTNFDQVKLAYATIVSVVTNGKSGSLGTMTAFKGVLTTTQIQDVAAFIYAAEHH